MTLAFQTTAVRSAGAALALIALSGCMLDTSGSAQGPLDGAATADVPTPAQPAPEPPASPGDAPEPNEASPAEPTPPSEQPSEEAPAEGVAWPSCDAPGASATPATISELWHLDPQVPLRAWLSSVVVTAISQGGCAADRQCQVFVQQHATYPDLEAGAHQALRVWITPGAAAQFVGIEVGDRIDLEGEVWRQTSAGYDELRVKVSADRPGCAAVVGHTTPVPVPAALDALTIHAYEHTIGPLLVRVDSVDGTPHGSSSSFALAGPNGYAGDDATSASPYFLPGGAFNAWPSATTISFTSVAGVFGVFVPSGTNPGKYEMIYPRTMADLAVSLDQ